MKGRESLHQEGKEMNKRQTRNRPIEPIEPRQPLEKGAHYLRKKSCEPVLSQEKLKAELERRKELVTIDQTWSGGSEHSDRGQDDEQGRRARRYLPQDADFCSISPRHSAAVVSVLRISSPTFSRVG